MIKKVILEGSTQGASLLRFVCFFVFVFVLFFWVKKCHVTCVYVFTMLADYIKYI